jgi:hypothetical protein
MKMTAAALRPEPLTLDDDSAEPSPQQVR